MTQDREIKVDLWPHSFYTTNHFISVYAVSCSLTNFIVSKAIFSSFIYLFIFFFADERRIKTQRTQNDPLIKLEHHRTTSKR